MVTPKILGSFVNTSTADHSSYKREKFPQAIQLQLSKTSKISYQFFIAFLQSTSNFEQFRKKDQAHSSTIFGIIDSKRSCYLNVLMAMF